MDIAIVGIDCRFPGASDLAQFWALLVAGETGLIQLSAADRDSAAVGESMQSPNFVPVAGSIGEADRFDAEFFGYTPREAAFLDPQQRVFLETCWRALEDAAQNPSATARTAVFAGAGLSTYLLNNVAPVLADGDETDAFLAYTANDKDFLATRVAFKLDLKGPAITVQTACSTSLVAVHLACQSLLLGECDVALAGGITIRVPENVGYHPVPDGIESLDGRCRPFDIQASGTVFSNGAGVMVLKRLSDAAASGDRIYAVIKGTAVNNDGFVKAGFTAPSAAGQAAVIAEALAVADVGADSISFVETHGTGTALGDGVELAALRRVFADCPTQGCALGATKANIGHADVAAGIAGLIKATLSLYHRTLPPMASWAAWGSALERDIGPFYVPTKATPLVPRGGVLRAGVSAFGVGGTNAHVVLEAPPAAAAAATDERPQLLVLSSRDAAALSRQIKKLAEAIPRAGPLADVSWTLQTGRAALAERACVAVRDVAEAARDLSEPQRVRTNRATDPPPRLAFLFPGQGAQFAGMGRTLYRDELVFAATIDAAAQRLRPALGFDLREALFADTHDLPARLRLRETAVSQPAVFAINIAMLNLLRDWGLVPDVVLGHSLGEYAAMVAAGVLSFDDALDIVTERGRLMQALPGGAMAAVLAPAEQVRRLLASGAEISAVNGPSDSVICGPAAAVAATTDVLNRMGIATRTLETSHAFHSAMIEPMLGELARFAADRPRASPRIGLISNLTGALLRTAPDGAYFADHARQPVRFADGISTLLAEGPIVALEVGPGTALSSLARRQGLKGVCATMPLAGDRQAALEAVGVLWCAGLSPDWTKLHRPPRARVSLPSYPFAKTRHWIEAQTIRTPRRPATRELDIRIAGWRRHHPEPGTLPQGHHAIVGADDNSSRRLADRLEQLGAIAQIGVDHAREPITCLIVTSLQEAELPALLERALAGGRLRHCLFLLPGLFDVDGSELLSADAAALAGLALALAREQPEIAVRIVDPGTADPAALLPLLFAAPKPFSAWRRQSCWVPDFQPFALLPATKQSAGLAYLVIGATGTVGRIAAATIAAGDPTGTIYLASRRGGAIPGVAGEPRRIDGRNPGPLIDEIVARHGRIGGVIFAAGSLSASTFAAVTEPLPTDYRLVKREGLAALVDALEGVRCQFVIVCGSISCWLGGTGYGGYAGANLAAASIARTAARAQDTRWITLSLDAIADSASPRPGLHEIQADQLAQVLMGSIAATALSGAEIVVAASDFSVRYTDFAHAIGQGAAPPDVTPGEPGTVNADPVAEAWRAVLGIDDAKDDDSFFGLGGSSLQALQLLARLQRGAGIDLRLATFLQTPTLAALRLQVAASPTTSAVVVAPTVDGPPPLTEGQLSLWLSEQRKETAGLFNITELYRMDGVADVRALRTAFAIIEARHEGLRTRFVEKDGRPVQVIDAPGRCIVSEETIAAEQLEACLSEEVFRRMDIAIEPPWRVRLLDAGSAGRFLMLSAHHLLLDDWSIGLFFKELAEAYDNASTNQPAQISPPVRCFSEFCRAQAEMSRAGRYDGSLEHWRRRLAGAPRRLPLQPPLSSREADGALPVHLDATTIRALRAIGERRETSLFTVLLAVFKTCLAGETGARDVVVGVPQAGRPAGDWDRVLGYFVNPAALRTDVSEAADFLSLVTTVKAAVIDATAHDQVPYERVAAALGSHNLFNVWFTILTHADPCIMSGGLKLVPTRLGPRPSRFDVALVLEPDGEGLTGWLEYSGALVARKAAQRLVARFGDVIERITVRPETPMALLLGVDLVANSIIDLPTTRLDLTGRLRQRRRLSDWRSSGGQ
jgi:acyl transferase domain-containing protein/aryl carrier-like protein